MKLLIAGVELDLDEDTIAEVLSGAAMLVMYHRAGADNSLVIKALEDEFTHMGVLGDMPSTMVH